MLINYTKPNVFTAPLVLPKGQAVRKLLRFMPGVNEVSKEDWKQFQKDHTKRVERFLGDGTMEVVAETVGDDEKTALTDLTAGKAKLAVGKTLNIALLQSWRDAETRAGVVKAINAQLQMIDDKTTPDEKRAVNE